MTELVSSSADSFSGKLDADGFHDDNRAVPSGLRVRPAGIRRHEQDRFFRPHLRSDLGGGEHSVPDDADHPHGQQCGIGRHRRG